MQGHSNKRFHSIINLNSIILCTSKTLLVLVVHWLLPCECPRTRLGNKYCNKMMSITNEGKHNNLRRVCELESCQAITPLLHIATIQPFNPTPTVQPWIRVLVSSHKQNTQFGLTSAKAKFVSTIGTQATVVHTHHSMSIF